MNKPASPVLCLVFAAIAGHAQEASSGFELRSTVTGGATYSHQGDDPLTGSFRAMLYPTLKLNKHWSVSGTVQVHSQPFFFEDLSKDHHGARTDILQAHLSYSRFWVKRSLVIRAGQLSTAFGSFPLRYDDARNPLVDIPQTNSYYNGATTKGLAGAEVDATLDKVDLRGQFTNSSPSNARSIFDKDQYGAWTGGAGYTIRQGLRAGVSGFRGPYLDRHYPFYFPGEAKPRDLPGSGFGVDVQWGYGPWNVNGEWRRYVMEYRKIPTFHQQTGYIEIKRTLHPRWYAAARLGYLRASAYTAPNVYEMAVGFRPNSRQLVKVEYEIQQSSVIRGTLENVLAVQVVTTLKPFTMAWR